MLLTQIINVIFGAALFINALLFIPQSIKIFKLKTAKGVSLLTFLGLLIIQFAIVCHGIIQKDRVLIVGYVLSMLTTGLVVGLTLFYKKKDNLTKDEITLEEILQQFPGHIYWKDLNLVCRGANESNWRDFGCTSLEDYMGKTDYDILPKEKADLVRKNDLEVINTGKFLSVEESLVLPNGEPVIYLSHKQPLRDKHGKIIGILGVSIDVTLSKQKTLEELHMLENIIAAMPGNVYWMDRNGFYLGCNDNQAKVIGLPSRSAIVGKRNVDIPGFLIPDVLDPVNQEIMRNGIAISLEEPAILPNGTEITVMSNKVPLKNSSGEVTGLLGISIDITERKKQEEELRLAKEAAEAANHAKTEFVQNMQHDIRTPAAGIWGLLERLTDSEKDPERKEILKMATDAGQRLLNLCNDAVEFGHLEEHSKPLTEQKIDMRDMAQGVIELNLPAVFGKGLLLHFKVDADVPAYIKSDPFRLSRIFINLLGNAIKFTSKGEVSVHLSAELAEDHRHGCLTIAIQDTGIGIPNDKIERIFGKFNRGVASNTNQYPGTGLGLYVVKTFVDELDGDIEVKSREGIGSTFEITVPFIIPHAQQQKSIAIDKTYESPLNNLIQTDVPATMPGQKIKPKSTEKKPFDHRVLIVEDDAVCLYAEKDLFSRFTKYIATAHTVKEALELLAENHYDVVICDLGLPDGSGTEIVARVRAEPQSPNIHTPFIAMTAHRDKAKHKQAHDAGFNEVAMKPLTLEQAQGLLKFYDAAPDGGDGTEFDMVDPSELEAIDLEVTIDRLHAEDVKSAFKGLGIFLSSLEEDIPALQQAERNNDVMAIRSILHKIRGALCYTGAPRLEKAVFDLHKAVKSGIDLKEMPKKFNLVYQEVEVFKEWYDELAKADKE